jgi:hypothetical protein
MTRRTGAVVERTVDEVESSLRPFAGLVCPGITFDSGHVVWLFRFDETPTPAGAYADVWLESPDGTVTLYVDPADAGQYPAAYHEFDDVAGADIEWLTADHDRVALTMVAADGTTLDVDAELAFPLRARAVETLVRVTPGVVRRSALGSALGSRALSTLLGGNGLRLRGRTETGARYWGDADHLRTVRSASATLDGTDLGPQVSGTSTHDFGDVTTARDPYVVFGALHLEYPFGAAAGARDA